MKKSVLFLLTTISSFQLQGATSWSFRFAQGIHYANVGGYFLSGGLTTAITAHNDYVNKKMIAQHLIHEELRQEEELKQERDLCKDWLDMEEIKKLKGLSLGEPSLDILNLISAKQACIGRELQFRSDTKKLFRKYADPSETVIVFTDKEELGNMGIMSVGKKYFLLVDSTYAALIREGADLVRPLALEKIGKKGCEVTFTKNEIESVVLHEIGHAVLGHVDKKEILGIMKVPVASLVGIGVAHSLFRRVLPISRGGAVAVSVAGGVCGSAVSSLLMKYAWLAQSRMYESQADRYAAERLPVEKLQETQASYERRARIKSLIDGSKTSLSRLSATHPSNENRAAFFAEFVAKRKAGLPPVA